MMYSNGNNPQLNWEVNGSNGSTRRMAPRMRVANRTALRPLEDTGGYNASNGSTYDNSNSNSNHYIPSNNNQFGSYRGADNGTRIGVSIGSQAYASLRLPPTDKNNNNNNNDSAELPALKMTQLARTGMQTNQYHNNSDSNSTSSSHHISPRGQHQQQQQQRELAPLTKKSNRSGRQGTHRRRLKQESSVNEQLAPINNNALPLINGSSQSNQLPQIRRQNDMQQTQTQGNNSHFHSFQQQQQQQQVNYSTQQSGQREFASIYNEEHQFAAVTSIKGLKPGNPSWINQDNMFISEYFENKDLHFYCVLDGHGEHGHHVSRKCRESFLGHIKAANFDMKRSFAAMQNDLNTCEFDVRCSGATCVLVVFNGGRLSVSNCGDSRAVLGRRNQSGVIGAHALTNDHKPDKPEERKRILSCGGHLGCRQVLVNQPGRGPVSMPVGPCRVWYQYRGETLGLAMSRSLGDSVVHKSGVSAEPEIFEHMVDEYDEFVIIATDGVWDVVDNNQAVQMVGSFINKSPQWNPLEASACICKFARSRWEKLSPMVDDITCVVVKLRGRVE